MKIIITNKQKKKIINKKRTIKFIENILKSINIPQNSELGLLLLDNDQIKLLNKKYRKLNRPTDVLAFAMLEINKKDKSKIIYPEILGDIVISVERTIQQANDYKHTFQEEFALLIIHGILHLLGYDHLKKKDANIMQGKEKELIEKIKF